MAGVSGINAGEGAKFLIASSPSAAQVSYLRVRRGGSLETMGVASRSSMQVLIRQGLIKPQGIAVDQARQKLIVADSVAKKILSYPLGSKEDTLFVGSPSILAEDVQAEWVTVDGAGTVYFSDPSRNEIVQVPAVAQEHVALRGVPGPAILYSENNTEQVSVPGGVAADAFAVYWANTEASGQVGAVVRGLERPADNGAERVAVLPRASEKAVGVCLALDNVYYTQPKSTLYGVKKAGGSAVIVSDRFQQPRGCASDGLGTVYVADQGAQAVYSFAGGMQDLSAAQLSMTVELEDAFDVAIYSQALRVQLRLAAAVASLLLLALVAEL